ncbi:MAG: hypothetical protein J4N64_02750, partial [Chloroflexi bacterium]|nr:hypothetical protein [Chloroflexota bacterium]
ILIIEVPFMPGHAEKAGKQHDVCRRLPSASLLQYITVGCCQVLRLSNYLKKADALFPPARPAGFCSWGQISQPLWTLRLRFLDID